MAVKILRLIVVVIVSLASAAAEASVDGDNRRMVDSISSLLNNFDNVSRERSRQLEGIKSRRQQLPAGEHRIRVSDSLGRAYINHNIDSAMMYWRLGIREAEDMGYDELALRLRMNTLAAMPLQGISIEAANDFASIDPAGFSPDMLRHYYLSKSELYYNIQRPYPEGTLKKHYRDLAASALDSLSAFYSPESPVAAFVNAYLHLLRGESKLATASFIEALPALEGRPELYDCSIENVTDYYAGRPEYHSQYLNYLYKRVAKELSSGLVRPEVLGQAGIAIFDDGDKQLGRRLIHQALATGEAERGPYSQFDYTSYSKVLYDNSVQRQVWTLIIILALVAAIAALTVLSHRRRKRFDSLSENNSRLEEMHRQEVKDMQRISESLLSMALFSDEQLKEYNLFVHRKLKAGQVKDLYREVESGEYVQALSDKFFAMFDETFLDSFPDFVEHLNSLLSPGRQLSLLPGRRMTPELRIAAFMRLGICDSTKLAQVLGLSINTIYTYRNRLKGRAIDRKNFEAALASQSF